jgi:hypothetical protein
MNAARAHLRAWYLIAFALVPPLWAATDWHAYTHLADGAFVASYLALACSPALFVLGARRVFRRADAEPSSAP